MVVIPVFIEPTILAVTKPIYPLLSDRVRFPRIDLAVLETVTVPLSMVILPTRDRTELAWVTVHVPPWWTVAKPIELTPAVSPVNEPSSRVTFPVKDEGLATVTIPIKLGEGLRVALPT